MRGRKSHELSAQKLPAWREITSDPNILQFVQGVELAFAENSFPCQSGPAAGGGSVRADFNLRERPCYLSNINKILPLLLKFIGEEDFVKRFCQG